jgi:hypothetical protein
MVQDCSFPLIRDSYQAWKPLTVAVELGVSARRALPSNGTTSSHNLKSCDALVLPTRENELSMDDTGCVC